MELTEYINPRMYSVSMDSCAIYAIKVAIYRTPLPRMEQIEIPQTFKRISYLPEGYTYLPNIKNPRY